MFLKNAYYAVTPTLGLQLSIRHAVMLNRSCCRPAAACKHLIHNSPQYLLKPVYGSNSKRQKSKEIDTVNRARANEKESMGGIGVSMTFFTCRNEAASLTAYITMKP